MVLIQMLRIAQTLNAKEPVAVKKCQQYIPYQPITCHRHTNPNIMINIVHKQ